MTYFFNGGIEAPFPGEERLLVPSPKVATYDLQPEMSAGRRDRRADRGDDERPRTTSSSPTSPTRTWSATPACGTRRSGALEFIDGCLGRVVEALPADGLLCITADHGNADEMRDAEGHAMTAHSLNPVPIVLVGRAVEGRRLHDGVLADVAPTLLALAGLPPADGMTGRSLLGGD